jgi:hypothetical protein
VDAADQVTQLREGGLRLGVGLVDRAACPGRLLGELQPGQAQCHDQAGQPLLGAVVQIALDPTALGVERSDEPGSGPGELDHLGIERIG